MSTPAALPGSDVVGAARRGHWWRGEVAVVGYVRALSRLDPLPIAILAAVTLVVVLAALVASSPATVARLRKAAPVRLVERLVAGTLGRIPHRYRPPAVLVAGAAVVIGASLAFGELFDDVLDGDGVARFDWPVLTWLAAHRSSALTGAAVAVTDSADTVPITVIALVAAAAIAWWRRSVSPLAVAAVAMAGTGAIITITKYVVGRHRPPLPYAAITQTGLSFPSGHTLGSAVAYGILAWLLISAVASWPTRVWIATAALTATMLVVFTRLYLGVHWLTDVLAS